MKAAAYDRKSNQAKTYFPKNQSPFGSSENEYIARCGKASYSFLKRNESFLVASLARIDVDMSLLVLSGKDMRVADSQTVYRCRAFLKGGLYGPRRGECV